MDKDSKEYQLQMAIQLTDFVDYFIENGATKEDVKKMFVEIVDLIYVDKENLKWLILNMRKDLNGVG